ncbi:LysM peptidoglycan-binding domain-containing protein, partial [Deinococcus pimensis]|uniref:LysM peptidoglycan-binding domain-containing protein n=1 Tax=Deinococcus pimensis TaxID=309888 RepID=UPI0005EB2D20
MIRAARSGVRRARLTACAALAVSVLTSGALAAATYTVQPGDTAYSIARRSGLTVDALLSLNGLGAPTLSVGQVLIVEAEAKAAPPAPAAPATYTVVAGDSLYAVARRLGT